MWIKHVSQQQPVQSVAAAAPNWWEVKSTDYVLFMTNDKCGDVDVYLCCDTTTLVTFACEEYTDPLKLEKLQRLQSFNLCVDV